MNLFNKKKPLTLVRFSNYTIFINSHLFTILYLSFPLRDFHTPSDVLLILWGCFLLPPVVNRIPFGDFQIPLNNFCIPLINFQIPLNLLPIPPINFSVHCCFFLPQNYFSKIILLNLVNPNYMSNFFFITTFT